MDLIIDIDTVNFINEIKKINDELKSKKDPRKVCEFEMRLRTKDKKGLTPEIVNNIIKNVYGGNPVFKRTIVKNYSDGIRQITEYDVTNKVPIKSYFENKYGKQWVDKYYIDKYDKLHDYSIRYSFSFEERVDSNKSTKVENIRDRYRAEIEKNGYKFVFTHVNPRTNNETYEFEIEFDMDKLSIQLVNESLFVLYRNIVLSEQNVSSDQEENILAFIHKNILNKIKIEKPINLKNKHIDQLIREEYQVTNKLDGERKYLFIHGNLLYSVQNKNVLLLYQSATDFEHYYLLDTEFFMGSYHIFDGYCFDSVLVDKELLSTRLTRCKEFVAKLKCPLIAGVKQFSKELSEYTEHLLKTLNRDHNDGLIFTPENPNKRLEILKWKFPEKMSIDFRVKLSEKRRQMFKYDLLVGQPNNKESVFNQYLSKTELKDNGIYEFLYDSENNIFRLMRERTDKLKPNFVTVAQDIFKDMERPFTENNLKGVLKPLYHYRRYHNLIKRKVIETYCKEKTVLDLGCGRGGDLSKYEHQNIKHLYGVEPNKDNATEFIDRLKGYGFKDRVTLIQTKAQDTSTIVNEVGIEGVDIVSSFFSLSFFFSDEKDLDQLVQTISQNLKEDGVFIGTTIDGEMTKKVVSAEKDNTILFKGGFLRLNKDNSVVINIKDGIVGEQIESLVDFKLLNWKLEQVGIFLKSSHFFEPDKNLTENENKLNSLYRTFVFQKKNIMKMIKEISTTQSISDLLINSSDQKCFDMFEEYASKTKKIELVRIDPSALFNTLTSFYMYKKYIQPLNSPYFKKEVSIYGNRLRKTLVRQKVYNCIPFKDVKNKEQYKDKLSDIITLLQKNNINYGNLENILLCNNSFLFHQYDKVSSLKDSNSDKETMKKWFK